MSKHNAVKSFDILVISLSILYPAKFFDISVKLFFFCIYLVGLILRIILRKWLMTILWNLKLYLKTLKEIIKFKII